MPAQSGSWRARPIFISSTFRDMQAERDHLVRVVFPRLAEQLRQRRHHLEPIDLRLGVETTSASSEAARELLVLKVCLDEIKRSRPFLLVLLGDRYGWIPPEERMSAAAREQDFHADVRGKSVTALEIEFGILKDDKSQQRRSLFFFRRPLPYQGMPPSVQPDYSDQYSPDNQVRQNHPRLEALKQHLRADHELGRRVFDYSAGWDSQANKVTGLEEFGELVYQKLWEVIDADTMAFASQPAPSWQEQERADLAEFVEHRSRILVGRDELIHQLLTLATSPTVDGPMGSTTWGASLTGAPGSGKSAVFAGLYRELEKDPTLLLLANAPGGTPRGSSVDAMLRRFVEELATAASVANPLPEQAGIEAVEQAFYALLHRVAAHRRIVLIVDALDQFEPTPRGQNLTWFKPKQWPANARILATALPCPAAEELAQWSGIDEIELATLTTADAAEIGKQVCGKYHRESNSAVLSILQAKQTAGGPVCGNPLWLTMALEQLNLLDADDFARAERQFTGSPTQRMAALLADTAQRMPADVEGLYGWLLKENEQTFGRPHALAFTLAIALSRSGWRDTDLLQLLPRLAQALFPGTPSAPLDDLQLASLRRGFRAHLVRRGQHAQLDFFHAQMRRAVLHGLDAAVACTLHGAIADHLESLGEDDPLRIGELMGHLLRSADRPRIVRHLSQVIHAATNWISSDSPMGFAVSAVIEWLQAPADEAQRQRMIGGLAALLDDLTEDLTIDLASFFILHLDTGLANASVAWSQQARVQLLEAARAALGRQPIAIEALAETDVDLSPVASPSLARRRQLPAEEQIAIIDGQLAAGHRHVRDWVRHVLAASLDRLATIQQSRGDNSQAIKLFRQSQAIHKQSHDNSPIPDDIASQGNIGDMLLAQGDLPGALKTFEDALASIQDFASERFANVRMLRTRFQSRIADTLQAMGDLQRALQLYRAVLEDCQHMLEVTRGKTRGPLTLDPEDVQKVLAMHRGEADMEQDDINRIFADRHATHASGSDPLETDWQRAIVMAAGSIGTVLMMQHDTKGALEAYNQALAVAQQLTNADPSNPHWQQDLIVLHGSIGDALLASQDGDGAVRSYQECRAICARLLAGNPHNANLLNNTCRTSHRLGELLHARGDHRGSLAAFRERLAATQQLANLNPTNPQYLHGLAAAHYNVARLVRDVEGEQGVQKVVEHLQAALHSLNEMRRRNIALDPQMAQLHQHLCEILQSAPQ